MQAPERFPDEPTDAHAAFLAWLTDPQRSSPRRWARARSMHLQTVEGWAHRFAWLSRRDVYSIELDRAFAEKRLDLQTLSLDVERYLRRAARAQAKVACLKLEALARDADAAGAGAIELSARDAAALARDVGADLARLVPPAPQEAPRGRDLSQLTDAELDELARLEEKAERRPTPGAELGDASPAE